MVNTDVSAGAAIAISKINTGLSGSLVGTTDAQVLTQKTIVKRVNNVTPSSATITPDVNDTDVVSDIGATTAFTVNAPVGTPRNGNSLLMRFKDDGTPRGITWNGIYVAIGVTLPTTTVANKLTYVIMVYNADLTEWDVLGVTTQA